MVVTQKSPKHYRFTFVSRLQNLALSVIENLYRANDTYVRKGDVAGIERRQEFQRSAMTDLKLLAYPDKEYLTYCLEEMRKFLDATLHLEFNQKTQISPIKNGVDYLGFHFYLTETGMVIRKVKQQTKYKYRRKLKTLPTLLQHIVLYTKPIKNKQTQT